MTYSVVVTPEAGAGIRAAFLYIFERSPMNAQRWLRGLYARIDSLEQFPERCSRAREEVYLGEDLRQFVFQSHRAVFMIRKTEKVVIVLFVRHTKQRAIGETGTDE